MTNRRLIGSVALLALLTLATAGARAEGEGKYPDWGGQWFRAGGIQFDPTKPLGRGQQAPLTSEYRAKFEAGLADVAAGGHGLNEHASCLPHGMPRMINVIYPMEHSLVHNSSICRDCCSRARRQWQQSTPSVGFLGLRSSTQSGRGRKAN